MKKKKVLLVIDLQKEFYSAEKYEKVLNFIQSSKNEYDMILATIFKNYIDKNNFKEKLDWYDCKNTSLESIEFSPDEVIFKNTYGLNYSNLNKKYHYDIVGCDSDACIMATAFNLFDAGYDFSILSEYIYTSTNRFENETVIKMMKRNFGKCVI